MRAFVALDIDREVQDDLRRLIRELYNHTANVKWVDPSKIHLTLKFFASLPQAHLPALSNALSSVAKKTAPFPLQVRGLGFFARGDQIRTLWCGLSENQGRLATLNKAVEDALVQLGYPREDRPFKPHLTLGRTRKPSREPQLVEALKERMGYEAGVVQADHLVLYSSKLTPTGPIYRVLAQWRFEGRP